VMDLAEPTPANAATDAPDQAQEGGDAKIIVRSNGTVTYVGKDIAYHLWKFGLLARDFLYRPFHTHPDGHDSWITCSVNGEKDPPAFGHAHDVYNVIDTRQAYPQQVVVAGLRALGCVEQASRLVHLNYDVVALTPRCAAEMGYVLSDAEATKPFVEVSGRKGQGVKADDLLDQLEARAHAEVDSRHPESSGEQRAAIAHAISAGALRYFLLKFTRNSIIAFDFKDALSFDGETGPYIQYAIVRAQSIFRKLAEREPDFRLENAALPPEEIALMLTPPAGNDLWTLLLAAGSLGAHIQAAIKTQEPAFVAKYAFALAQAFNLFYHKHKILTEETPGRRAFLLHLTELVRLQLLTALTLMGIEAPEKM
jgi:arginyl-tRNA synthetase